MRKPERELLIKIDSKIDFIEKNLQTLRKLTEQLKNKISPDSKMPEKEALSNLYESEAKSLTEIAEVYDVATTTVLFWMKKLKIKRRKVGDIKGKRRYSLPSEFSRQWLVNKYETNSSTVIANKLGVTPQTVLRLLRDFGVEIREKSTRVGDLPRPTEAELRKLRNEGKTLQEIGELYGVTKESVRQWLKKIKG